MTSNENPFLVYWSDRCHHAVKQYHRFERSRLRHTFGTRLADAGIDVVKIKELIGYVSIVTTMGHIHATVKESEE